MKLYKDYDINDIYDIDEIGIILRGKADQIWEKINDGEKLYLLQIFEELYPNGTSWGILNDFIWYNSEDLLKFRKKMMEG